MGVFPVTDTFVLLITPAQSSKEFLEAAYNQSKCSSALHVTGVTRIDEWVRRSIKNNFPVQMELKISTVTVRSDSNEAH